MFSFLIAATLLAPAQTELPTRVLTLPLDSSSVPKEALAILDGKIATVLSEDEELEVITQEDLERMAALEAERAALGCETDSCLAEIAGALGADLVVYGRVAKLGEKFILQLNMFDASRAGATAREELEAIDLGGLADDVPLVVGRLVAARLGRAPPPTASDDGIGAGLYLAGGGGALAAAGAVGLVGGAAALTIGALLFFLTEGVETRRIGQGAAWAGAVLTVVGLIAIVGGASVAGVGLVMEE